jgi:hypothetical protein
MRDGRPTTCATLVLAALLGACGPANHTESTLPERERASPAVLCEVGVEATAGPDVTRLELACADDATESCNALDDDCDARVDEGCGYGASAVQVTATWGTGADVDLLVTEPGGATVGGEAATSHAGSVDRASRGACGDTPEDAARIENISFGAANEGRYVVALVHRDACAEGETAATPTPASVTVVVGAAIVGTWNVLLAPGARAELVTVAVHTRRMNVDAPTP